MKYNEWETIRNYGKQTQVAFGYYEVEYEEHHMDGRITTGTEDFSGARLFKLPCYEIFDPIFKDGRLTWESKGSIRVSSYKKAELLAFLLYGEKAIVIKFS